MEEKLDKILEILKYILALNLYGKGVPKAVIAKQLRIRTEKIIKMLEGVKIKSEK